MIAYRYTIENQSIETFDLKSIPEGLHYETFEIQEEISIEVPASLSRRQLRLALVLSGFDLDAITQLIEQLPVPQKYFAKIAWNDAVIFERNDQMLISLAAELNLVAED